MDLEDGGVMFFEPLSQEVVTSDQTLSIRYLISRSVLCQDCDHIYFRKHTVPHHFVFFVTEKNWLRLKRYV